MSFYYKITDKCPTCIHLNKMAHFLASRSARDCKDHRYFGQLEFPIYRTYTFFDKTPNDY